MVSTPSSSNQPSLIPTGPNPKRPSLPVMVFFGLLALAGIAAYGVQLMGGLGVTGLAQPVFWGVYIVNFVFFIGIAHAGTLVSAVLRLVGADWCKPITRLAEVMTVIFLAIGGLQIFVDLGRPDRGPWFFLTDGRFQSPLLWDATSIAAYLFASLLYLYVPLLPDIGHLRDRSSGRWRGVYAALALNWRGTGAQWSVLHRSMKVMAVLIVPIAVSVHSVISFIFATTLQPGWHSTIFAPYFVIGAIFSGIAAILLVMALVRRPLEIEAAITDQHFRYMGRLLLVLCLVWAYFTLAEILPVAYSGMSHEHHLIEAKLTGTYAPLFWTMVFLNLVVPLTLLSAMSKRPVRKTALASVAVLIGMWIERYLILVPTLLSPRLPFPAATYEPTWVEGAITLGSIGLFGLAFLAFARLFPLVPLWETSAIAERPPMVHHEPSRWVRAGQYMIGAGLLFFLAAVLFWMGRLVRVAFDLQDAPWIAVGVTLVALPVFLILMAVVLGVVRGVMKGARAPAADAGDDLGRQHARAS